MVKAVLTVSWARLPPVIPIIKTILEADALHGLSWKYRRDKEVTEDKVAKYSDDMASCVVFFCACFFHGLCSACQHQSSLSAL